MEFIVFGLEMQALLMRQAKLQETICMEIILSICSEKISRHGLVSSLIWLLLKIGMLRMMQLQEQLILQQLLLVELLIFM
jgi:hypothetical protein